MAFPTFKYFTIEVKFYFIIKYVIIKCSYAVKVGSI